MVYNGIAAVLYLTAFLANAASVHPYRGLYFYGHFAAAAGVSRTNTEEFVQCMYLKREKKWVRQSEMEKGAARSSPLLFKGLGFQAAKIVQFFGAVVTLAYGASAFFSYLDWKGDGGNAATTTSSLCSGHLENERGEGSSI
ncbi:hypothetical protein INR49_005162 [Caranx melampygus]|nr:hypothetical protein INR49_005162 [Caranx melampygus]